MNILALGIVFLASADEPPVSGRPVGFSGLVGAVTAVEAEANSTNVKVGDTIRYTLRIVTHQQPAHAPKRPDLAALAAFGERFLVEDAGDGPQGPREFVFMYDLRPRDTRVAAIPPVRVDFYRPGVLPKEKGFQARYGPEIPLTVRPATAEYAGSQRSLTSPPDAVLQVFKGLSVLDPPAESRWVHWVVAYVILIPLLCGVIVWNVRRSGKEYSDAAIRAARQLEDVDNLGGEQTAEILTRYLCERWSWTGGELAGAEVEDHLLRRGCCPSIARRAGQLVNRLDGTRYRSRRSGDEALLSDTAELILGMDRSK
jgi:hypothetical protein